MSLIARFIIALMVTMIVLPAIVLAAPSFAQGAGKAGNNYLNDFNYGNVIGNDTQGRTLRTFTLIVEETNQVPISINGNDSIMFPAWTFNGTVPGPTIRMTEGDHVQITVKNSPDSQFTHSLHMHSRHNPAMDGTTGPSAVIEPGESFTYDFIAGPTGVYPYHCHVEPIVDHINRGLYGAMIIDPPNQRPAANEMVMMMNSYDLDLNVGMEPTFSIPTKEQADEIYQIANDTLNAEEEQPEEETDSDLEAQREELELEIERDNEIYTVNGKAFEYMTNPIEIKAGEPVRIYLLNMVEFDPVNNFHLHSDMFHYVPSGTLDTPAIHTDVVTLSQGDRGIIEFTPKAPGQMMFHAHINEFSLLGWMGLFNVVR